MMNRPSLSRSSLMRTRVALGLIFFAAWSGFAQGSQADYERAASLGKRFQGKVFRDRVEAHWLSNNTQFWYEVKTGTNSREFISVNANKGERSLAFDHGKLAGALHEAGIKDARPDNLSLQNLDWPSPQELLFTGYGKSWRLDLDRST